MAAYLQVKYTQDVNGWTYEIMSDSHDIGQSARTVSSLVQARALARSELPGLGYDAVDLTNKDLQLAEATDTVMDFILVIARNEEARRWLPR